MGCTDAKHGPSAADLVLEALSGDQQLRLSASCMLLLATMLMAAYTTSSEQSAATHDCCSLLLLLLLSWLLHSLWQMPLLATLPRQSCFKRRQGIHRRLPGPIAAFCGVSV